MTDTRPRYSPTPAEAAAIGQTLVDQLKPMLDDAFARIVALEGNPAERENDALSVLATIGSFVAQQLTAQLMRRKRVGLDVAFPTAMNEIHTRAAAQLLALVQRRKAN